MTTLNELNRLNMYPRNEDSERQLDWLTGTTSLERSMNAKVRDALVEKREQDAQIHNLLYEALEAIDAPLDLLQIVGSWKDTQTPEQTLEQLEAFIAREKASEGS